MIIVDTTIMASNSVTKVIVYKLASTLTYVFNFVGFHLASIRHDNKIDYKSPNNCLDIQNNEMCHSLCKQPIVIIDGTKIS